MSGINKVILVGRLGQDPEVRYTPDNRAIANISLATSETWKDKNTGQKQEKTEWHRVVFFGGLAQIVADYVKKGSQIYIEGKLQTKKWQDNNGQDRYTTEVVVDGFSGTMQMLGGPQDNQQQNNQQQGNQQQPQQNQQSNQESNNQSQQGYNQQNRQQSQQNQQSNQQNNNDNFDDDIPF